MAIAVLVALLLMAIGVLIKWMVGRSSFAKFLTTFVVSYVFFGLPQLLYATTLQGALCSLIVPLCFGGLGVAESESEPGSEAESGRTLPWLPDVLFFAFGALLTAWLIGGFGFWNERMGGDRQCQGGSLVAGVYRDNLVLKALPKAGAELDDAVTLLPTAGAVLHKCDPHFTGGRGLSFGEPRSPERK